MTIQRTRRETLYWLAGGGVLAVLPRGISAAKGTRFPKGAVIRTIQKDLPPDALVSGVTLSFTNTCRSIWRGAMVRRPNSRPLPPTSIWSLSK